MVLLLASLTLGFGGASRAAERRSADHLQEGWRDRDERGGKQDTSKSDQSAHDQPQQVEVGLAGAEHIVRSGARAPTPEQLKDLQDLFTAVLDRLEREHARREEINADPLNRLAQELQPQSLWHPEVSLDELTPKLAELGEGIPLSVLDPLDYLLLQQYPEDVEARVRTIIGYELLHRAQEAQWAAEGNPRARGLAELLPEVQQRARDWPSYERPAARSEPALTVDEIEMLRELAPQVDALANLALEQSERIREGRADLASVEVGPKRTAEMMALRDEMLLMNYELLGDIEKLVGDVKAEPIPLGPLVFERGYPEANVAAMWQFEWMNEIREQLADSASLLAGRFERPAAMGDEDWADVLARIEELRPELVRMLRYNADHYPTAPVDPLSEDELFEQRRALVTEGGIPPAEAVRELQRIDDQRWRLLYRLRRAGGVPEEVLQRLERDEERTAKYAREVEEQLSAGLGETSRNAAVAAVQPPGVLGNPGVQPGLEVLGTPEAERGPEVLGNPGAEPGFEVLGNPVEERGLEVLGNPGAEPGPMINAAGVEDPRQQLHGFPVGPGVVPPPVPGEGWPPPQPAMPMATEPVAAQWRPRVDTQPTVVDPEPNRVDLEPASDGSMTPASDGSMTEEAEPVAAAVLEIEDLHQDEAPTTQPEGTAQVLPAIECDEACRHPQGTTDGAPAVAPQPEIHFNGRGRVEAAGPSLGGSIVEPEPDRGPAVLRGPGFGFLVD